MNIYFFTSFLFLTVAVLGAVDAASVSMNIIPPFAGLRWLRVHLITLGVMAEAVFGLLPALVATKIQQPKPSPRLDIWLLLTSGILSLLVGIPLINRVMISAGGLLVLTATTLLIRQLLEIQKAEIVGPRSSPLEGRKFYLMGLAYLLLGIFIGMGLWQEWLQFLNIGNALEVHIHANNWGLVSLLFAGSLVDLYPRFTGRAFAWPQSITPIFWLMTLGALGLVLGPWTKLQIFTVPGLVMHLTGTIWLLLNIFLPLRGTELLQTPGIWHLLTSYFWILAPILVAPFILLGVSGFPGVGVEQNAPQALIYGWVLQFGLALLPYVFARTLLHQEHANLGGTWFSFAALNLGGLSLWASIFAGDLQDFLHGLAYLLWALGMIPGLKQLWAIVRQGYEQSELSTRATVS